MSPEQPTPKITLNIEYFFVQYYFTFINVTTVLRFSLKPVAYCRNVWNTFSLHRLPTKHSIRRLMDTFGAKYTLYEFKSSPGVKNLCTEATIAEDPSLSILRLYDFFSEQID